MQGTTDQKGGQAPMIGTSLSHYRVTEKLGQGGMGEVHRAEDRNLSRQVAIKVLPDPRRSRSR